MYLSNLSKKLKGEILKDKNIDKNDYIAIFDSGFGGISVLKDLKRSLPFENFLYYGDNLNAPYGTKSKNFVLERTRKIFEELKGQKIKAFLIACNTATSVAVDTLRKDGTISIIGMEPALKPAIIKGCKKIAVLATKMTLEEEKFSMLVQKNKTDQRIISLQASELVDIIENSSDLENDIRKALSRIVSKSEVFDSLVLGCTHFVLVKKEIQKFFGDEITLFDGNEGTKNQLIKKLEQKNLLREKNQESKLKFLSSNDKEIEKMRYYFEKY